MNTRPRVSIIIPTFNSAAFVAEAVQSVLDQTYSDYEIIVADDGSTDNTKEALQRFGDRLTFLTLPHTGICATRNAAIKQSRGEFIALLDSDDIWEADKLELQVEYLDQHPEYGLVYCYSTNFTDASEGNVALVKKVDFEGHIFKDLFTKNSFANSTIVIRRTVFDEAGGYDESLTAMEDYDLNLRISQKHQIGRVAKSLMRRRIHPGSFYSSGYDNQYVYQLPVYDKYMRDPAVEKLVGKTAADYMSGFIIKFIFKNLFDGRDEFIAQKLQDLERFSPEKAALARQYVQSRTTKPEVWRPLVDEFDTWYDDVKHKAVLYKSRRAVRFAPSPNVLP
jgi:glycosyltransferase involved in cell wall biosynthesis